MLVTVGVVSRCSVVVVGGISSVVVTIIGGVEVAEPVGPKQCDKFISTLFAL